MGLQEKLLECQRADHQGAALPAKIKKVGHQDAAPETLSSRTYHRSCNPGMKNKGSESQDQKFIASHHLQSCTSAPENSTIP